MSEPPVKLKGFGPYDNLQPLVPGFSLAAVSGKKDKNGKKETVSNWDYKQRNPLVIYLLPTAEADFLTQLESERLVYREYKAEILALVRVSLATLTAINSQLQLSYPLLADEDGAVFEKFLKLAEVSPAPDSQAAVFITDRYGAATRYALTSAPQALPPVSEIAATLDFLTNLCSP